MLTLQKIEEEVRKIIVTQLDISEDAIQSSEKGFNRLVEMIDRLNNLKRLVNSVGNYINEINEIIIIDSSSKKIHTEIIHYFKNFKNIKVLKSNPSTSKQSRQLAPMRF